MINFEKLLLSNITDFMLMSKQGYWAVKKLIGVINMIGTSLFTLSFSVILIEGNNVNMKRGFNRRLGGVLIALLTGPSDRSLGLDLSLIIISFQKPARKCLFFPPYNLTFVENLNIYKYNLQNV